MYAPGHDAKHVSALVRRTIEMWKDSPWETGQAWQSALRQLPTVQLQSKYRSAMFRAAERNLGYAIDKMDDEVWLSRLHVQRLLTRDDPNHFGRVVPFSSRRLAIAAAALGWTRHAINVKHS